MTIFTLLKAALLGRCPKCLIGPIFENGLSVKASCPECGLGLSEHDTGDGPAVAATFVIGLLAIVVALLVELKYEPSMWVHMAIATPIVVIGSYFSLFSLKGMTIALQYKYRSVDKVDDSLGQM